MVGKAYVAAAAWAEVAHLVVGWPSRSDVWRDDACPAQKCMLAFIEALVLRTRNLCVTVAIDDDPIIVRKAGEKFQTLTTRLGMTNSQRLNVLLISMDDCWLRDTGPICLKGPENDPAKAACFQFNAWGGQNGGCYSQYERDRAVGQKLCVAFGMDAVLHNIVLEGGSVCSDGEGTLLTTEECLLNSNRNFGLSKQQIERVLRGALGAETVIWLKYGAAFDSDTDGHVDNMAMFCGPGRVLLLWAEKEVCPEQHQRSVKAMQTLNQSVDARNRRLQIFKVTMSGIAIRSLAEANGVDNGGSGAKTRAAGERLCASYVNVVSAEQYVFAPAFGDEGADERARQDLQAAVEWSGKEVIMIPAREFVLAGGGLHCLTLGIPQRRSSLRRPIGGRPFGSALLQKSTDVA